MGQIVDTDAGRIQTVHTVFYDDDKEMRMELQIYLFEKLKEVFDSDDFDELYPYKFDALVLAEIATKMIYNALLIGEAVKDFEEDEDND